MQTCQAFHHNIFKLALTRLQDQVNVHNAEERQKEQHVKKQQKILAKPDKSLLNMTESTQTDQQREPPKH